MKQLTALIWKEWHEVRVLFAIALFVFLGLPIIGGIQFVIFNYGRFSVDTSLWVFFLGGLFSIIVGVGIVARDVNGKLEEFWRSRPVSIGQWLLIKYIVGLCVVLVALILPIWIERYFGPTAYFVRTSQSLAWHPFLWIALFSISFAIACIVRRGAHAGMLSVAIALLLYFLPTIVPPLRFLSLIIVSSERQKGVTRWVTADGYYGLRLDYFPWLFEYAHSGTLQLKFVAGMLTIAIVGSSLAIIALRRDWRIEAGRKMLYWSVGAALLLLFSTAAFQVAANLTVLGSGGVPVNPELADLMNSPVKERYGFSEFIQFARVDRGRGILISMTTLSQKPTYARWVRRFTLVNDRVEFDEPIKITHSGGRLDSEEWLPYGVKAVWNPKNPDALYHPGEAWVSDPDSEDPLVIPIVATIDLRPDQRVSRSRRFLEAPLPLRTGRNSQNYFGEGALIYNNQLYSIGQNAYVFDLADPYQPKLVQTYPAPYGANVQLFGADKIVLPLPQIPGLPPRQRLELMASCWDDRSQNMLDGEILLRNVDGPTAARLLSYKLSELSDTNATFLPIGEFEGSFINSWFTGPTLRKAAAGGVLFYTNYGRVGGLHLTAIDLNSPSLSSVGHFAFGESDNSHLIPLPDGRLLAISLNKYVLLAAPTRNK